MRKKSSPQITQITQIRRQKAEGRRQKAEGRRQEAGAGESKDLRLKT
jgi:hypothetical protein